MHSQKRCLAKMSQRKREREKGRKGERESRKRKRWKAGLFHIHLNADFIREWQFLVFCALLSLLRNRFSNLRLASLRTWALT